MNDFGGVDSLEAEAIGQPGQRTFRLRIRSGTAAASVWLEKEQLAALSLALRQLLGQLSGGEMPEPRPPPDLMPDFPAEPDVDFKVGRLALGYDDSEGKLIIFAYDTEAGEDSPPTLACRATPGQARALSDMADAAVAAGRPICPLCGGPIDPEGHICPRSNGHGRREIAL